MTSKRALRFGVCGAVLGAVYLGLAASAMAWTEPLWVRQFGTAGWDEAYAVATDAAGNVYLTGYTYGSLGGPNQGGQDAWVAKYDAAGHALWKRQFGTYRDDRAWGVAADAQGNVYLAGDSTVSASPSSVISDAWVAKYDAAGNALWKRQMTTAEQLALGAATDAEGNVYLTGVIGSGGGDYAHYDAWVAKYDAAGRALWKRQFGTYEEWPGGVATDAAGNAYLTGDTYSSLWDTKGYDAWVAKYDAAGHTLWVRQQGTADYDSASGVATDAEGNVYLSGATNGSLGGPNQGGHDAWVAKYDAAGHALWVRQLGTADHESASGVATDAEGNVYLSGYEGCYVYWYDPPCRAWVAKYDAAGHALWKRQLGTGTDAFSSGVATDDAGNVYLSGATNGSLGGPNQGGHDAWVAKYSTQR